MNEIGKTEKASAIFGGAKPVDTASREKEIEARLRRESVEAEPEDEASSPGNKPRLVLMLVSSMLSK